MLRVEIIKKVRKLLLFGGEKYINAILFTKLAYNNQ
jgi:hypothetical protein